MPSHPLQTTELILGNSNPKFSGVTSTMLEVMRYQKDLMPLAVLGRHHLAEDTPTISFSEAIEI